MLYRCRRSKSGFVLVSVLMLGVLLISCATVFSWFVRMQVRGVFRELDGLSRRTMAGVLANSLMLLLTEAGKNMNSDSPIHRIYKPFILNVPDMGIWVIQVTPLDDKIPMRNLFLPDGNTLRREFSEVWRGMWDKLKHRELEMLTLDFMDKNIRPRVGSREEKYYVNRGLYDISELLILSNDINADIIYGSGGEMGLSDYCTVYSDGRINLNVAPLHVMELLPGLEMGGFAQSIEEYRKENALEKIQDLQKIPGLSARTSTRLMNLVSFKSRYFNIKLEYMNDNEETASYTIIFDRTGKKIVRWDEVSATPRVNTGAWKTSPC